MAAVAPPHIHAPPSPPSPSPPPAHPPLPALPERLCVVEGLSRVVGTLPVTVPAQGEGGLGGEAVAMGDAAMALAAPLLWRVQAAAQAGEERGGNDHAMSCFGG